MFAKIMKHDFKTTSRPLGLVWGLSTLAVIGIIIMIWLLPQSLGTAIGRSTGNIVAVAGISASLVVTVLMYYQSMYGNTAFFIHMIPVRGRVIVSAKTIFYLGVWLSAIIVALIQIILVNVNIMLKGGMSTGDIWAAFQSVFSQINGTILTTAICVMVLLLLSYILWWEFVVTVGNRPEFVRFGKLGGLAVVAVLTWLVQQLLTVALIFFVPGIIYLELTAGGIPEQWSFDATARIPFSVSADFGNQPLLPIGVLILIPLAIVFFWWFTARSVERATALQ
ncbi:MAG: hypothetical protein Q4P71_06420 [Actinomycetaceae bacterium]|nr:hypothetical protein [Actinomycetaceae bacterium]